MYYWKRREPLESLAFDWPPKASIQVEWVEKEYQVLVAKMGKVHLLEFTLDNGSSFPVRSRLHDWKEKWHLGGLSSTQRGTSSKNGSTSRGPRHTLCFGPVKSMVSITGLGPNFTGINIMPISEWLTLLNSLQAFVADKHNDAGN